MEAPMTEWVRDPDALRTIMRLRTLRVGDQVIERRTSDGFEAKLISLNENTIEQAYVFYGADTFTAKSDPWELVAWRRPNKEGG
jgi:hypothetical protein